MKRKKGKGVLRVILLLVIVCGVGIALHMSGYDRNIAVRFGWIDDETAVKTLETERDSQEAILTEQEKSQKAEMEDAAEETTEMSDEQEQFLEKLSFDPIEMTMGETYQVELERKIEDAVWKSSDETVVKVSEGQLKAIMPGTATVTFLAGEKELDFEVTVNNFPDMTLAVNCSKRMEINDAFSDIIWESSMPEIVSVEDGTIRSLESEQIPRASDYSEITENGCMINMLLLDIDAYEEKYGEKAVRKNLTIPAWLNTFAEKNNFYKTHYSQWHR